MTPPESQEPIASDPIILIVEDSADDWFIIQWILRQQYPQTQPVWLTNADEIIPNQSAPGYGHFIS